MSSGNNEDLVDPRPDINYALVEGTRPPIYKAMKYWGKKPHNIWSTYIERYCPPDGIVLDPFVGSGIAALEAAKLGRHCIAFDLNPLSGFFIEALATPLDEPGFRAAYDAIVRTVQSDCLYKKHYTTTYENESALVYNYRWLDNELSEVVLETTSGLKARIPARPSDKEKTAHFNSIKIPYWFPEDKFPKTPSITHKFIKDLGGDSFADLWTRRNLYLLSLIFHQIMQVAEKSVQLHLLSGFIQTLHLTFRMVYPRSASSKRDFSGSWGRADYMIRRKAMEQNPLVVFQRSCMGKQGVLPALKDAKSQYPEGIIAREITASRRILKRPLINYGTVDVADLHRYLKPKSVDFIITDPPYAGLVYYLDLSLVWLVWLKRLDAKRFSPDLLAEITIKDGQIGREEYRRRLTNAFKQLHRVLKDDGKIVITFHHQQIKEWNEFVNAVRMSGFTFDKITHQYNRRSGESNVANPYGTSGSDFYIRCVKQRDVDFTSDASGLDHFVVQKAIEIIARRNEPTPYNFIFDGLVPELLQAGHSHFTKSRDNVVSILKSRAGPGKVFTCNSNKESKAGDVWWFNKPELHISHPDRPLQDRVEETIVSLLRRKVSVRLDDVIGELFREYPNGLTPDIRAVRGILEKYAFPSSGYWKIKDTTRSLMTQHTAAIEHILKIGSRARRETFVGRREQPESCSGGKILRDIASCHSLASLADLDSQQLDRIAMIDVLWLNAAKTRVDAAFEVENSTNFTSALQRASNLPNKTPKFMVIPDRREDELTRTADPLFVDTFRGHSWAYVTYSSLEKLSGYSKASLNELKVIAKNLL